MPIISRFFGIVIMMFYDDHPPPHFHVRYGNEKASIGIDSLQILEGKLSPRVISLVVEWANQHRDELRNDWEVARQRLPIEPIEPLK